MPLFKHPFKHPFFKCQCSAKHILAMSTSISIYFRKEKVNKHNESFICAKISHNNEFKRISLGIKINANDWDFEYNKVKENAPNREYLQLLIDMEIQKINKKILNYQIQNQPFTLDDLLGITEKKLKSLTIKHYFQKEITTLQAAGQFSSVSKYKYCLSSLCKYRSMDIPFTDINYKFLIEFEMFLRKAELADNSIATLFSTLKAAFNSALDQGLFTCKESPFKKFKVGRLWIPTQKRAIQKENIYELKAINLSDFGKNPSPYLELAIDTFMFSYYTAGINFKDIATLKYKNMDTDHIYYSRSKTQKNLTIKLLPEALAILNKYIKKDFDIEDYIFPILNRHIHTTEQQKFNRIQKTRRKINQNLQLLSKKLNVNIKLTTYVARHTFASVLQKSGVNIGIISESLGHTNQKTTQIYLNGFENTQIDEAMKNLR